VPADSTRNTLLRQWALLRQLPSHGAGKSADALCKELESNGFKVSKRQVERDLKALSECLPLDCNDKGMPYGWRWADSGSASLPGMTLAEALSMRIVEDTLRPLLPASVLKTVEARFRQAAKTLTAQEGNNLTACWANKVRTVATALPLVPPHIPTDVLETVQDALLASEQVEVEYLALGKEQARTYALNPLGLLQRGPVTYLVATVFTYTDPRIFAVHRIRAAKRLHLAISPRPDFNLDAYIQSGAMQFGGSERIRLELKVNALLARILEETPLSEDQILEHAPEGGHVVATVLNTPQLQWWLLSQCAGLEVIAPVDLRERIADQLNKAADRYRN